MFIDFKFLAAFFGQYINQFLVIIVCAFLFMITRSFIRIVLHQAIVENPRALWRCIKAIELDDLIAPAWEVAILLSAILVFLNTLCRFEIITNKSLIEVFARPEFLTGFIISIRAENVLFVDLPRTASQKQRLTLSCILALLFDALFAIYFMPILFYCLIKITSLGVALAATVLNFSAKEFMLKVGIKLVNTGVVFSIKSVVLATAGFVGALIPLPFSEGFFVFYPILSDKVVAYLMDLSNFGKFVFRFLFILFFLGFIQTSIKGPLHSNEIMVLYKFLGKTLFF